MSIEIAVKEQEEIIAKKQKSWGEFGVGIYKSELSFQVRAQQTISKVIYPTTIEQVAEAEAVLKVVKQEQAALEKDRKEITSRFDDVASRLMLPAKSINEPIAKATQAIISVKSEYAKRQQLAQEKAEEIRRIKETIKTYLANADMQAKSNISIQVTTAYEYALITGNIKPAEIREFVRKCSGKMTEKDFALQAPAIQLRLVQPEELNLIFDETFHFNPAVYVQLYSDELDRKFVDYAVAYINKQDALAASKAEEQRKQEALKAENVQKNMAASIAAQATPLDVPSENIGPVVKDLKKSYEVDMVETAENAILIMSAFVANFKLCNAKLRVNKWFAITPGQMAVALAKVRCDDNMFQPTGIIFKEVDKL